MSPFMDPNDPHYSDTPDASLHPLEGEKNVRPAPADPPSPLRTLRDRIHEHRDGCNGRPHRRWYRGENKCDTLAALASSPAPAGLDEALARAIEGGYSDESIDLDRYQTDPIYHAVAWEVRKHRAATRPAEAPAGLDEERLADWMMDHLPEYQRWIATGWQDTMRDEAVVLARDMIRAATRPAEDAGERP